MKILCVADHVDPLVYSFQIEKRFPDIDFVIGCGDLRLSYYDFIISNLNKPLYFIFGNHHLGNLNYYKKKQWRDYSYFISERTKFRGVGATYLECKCIKHGNLLLMGLGGSIRYNNGENQFTDFEMYLRILTTVPRLFYNKLRYGRFLDVLVTHAPPFEIHDQKDRCHRGFKAFRWFIKAFQPRYLIHGHIHLYSKTKNRSERFYNTEVINAYDHFILVIEDEKAAGGKQFKKKMVEGKDDRKLSQKNSQ